MPADWTKVQSDMSRAFETGVIDQCSDEDLKAFLINTCTGHVPNDQVRHRELARAITINHLQMSRLIQRLNTDYQAMTEKATELQGAMHKINQRVLLLTGVLLVVGILQIIATIAAK